MLWYWRWIYGFTGSFLLTRNPKTAALATTAGMAFMKLAPPTVIRSAAATVLADAAVVGRAVLGTTTANVAAAASLGAAVGAVVGTGISYAVWGEEGARDALDLYTGEVSAKEYIAAVTSPAVVSQIRANSTGTDTHNVHASYSDYIIQQAAWHGMTPAEYYNNVYG